MNKEITPEILDILRRDAKQNLTDVQRTYLLSEQGWTEEDYEEGMCGKLLKAMYGTRDAPQNLEFEYADSMTDIGFRKGKAAPCAFDHEPRNLRVVVHGLSLIHI